MKSKLCLLIAVVVGSWSWNLMASSLEKLTIDKTQRVQIEHLIVQNLNELGTIKANRKNSTYMTNDDVIYLDLKDRAVSSGDQFTVVRLIENVNVQKNRSRARGMHIQILANVRVSFVGPQWVEAVVRNAVHDLTVGDLIVPMMSRSFDIKGQEPERDLTGHVIKAAEQHDMIGPFHFAFINLGTADGVRLNDQFIVYNKAYSNIGTRDRVQLPDIDVARVVVVQADEQMSTVYTLAGSAAYQKGAELRSDLAQVRYLNQGDVDLSAGSNSGRRTQ